MKKIAVYGAGGFGREVQMLINQINNFEKKFDFIGFFDDGIKQGQLINNYPVIGGMSELNRIKEPVELVFAIADPKTKKNLELQIINPKINYPVLIHPNALIGDMEYVKIGDGSIIAAGSIITVNIEIGRHVILNLSCTIGHDTRIGDYSSFMPAVNVSGEVNIAEGVYAGTGAKIINQLDIGEFTVIGAGSVVNKSLPAHCTAVGVPAKPIKFNNNI
ncbi:MAG TPA: acetyltransferase [Bacteroidales bacterium]|nr:acetyltransferase [Bacteroidales bacterium]